MHRSGTTFLGAALEKLEFVDVLHEPFNKHHGLSGVPRWYPSQNVPDDVLYFESVFKELLAGTAHFRRGSDQHGLSRKIGRLLFGSRQERDYHASLRRHTTHFVLKDPFLLRMIPRLVERGVPVIVMLRHPAAIFLSIKRLNWPLGQDVIEGLDVSGAYGVERAVATMWSELYGPLIQHMKSYGKSGLLVVDHEVMVQNIDKFSERLLKFLIIESRRQRDRVVSFLRDNSRGSIVTPDNALQHNLTRDSRALGSIWREEVTADQLAVIESIIKVDFEYLREMAN